MKTPATLALDALGIGYEVVQYEHDNIRSRRLGGFGNETAAITGLSADVLFKTLVVSLGTELAVGVVPVAGHLDLKAVAKALGAKKAEMAAPAAAERSSGYVTGGISPLGQRTKLRTVLDESAMPLDRLYVSGGRRGVQLSLAPADLVRACDALVAPIATW